MSTTSLKLSAELKRRAATAALSQGLTPHAFMVAAIDTAVTAAEVRATFVAEALAARTAMSESGQGYAADEVHAYIRKRASGIDANRPKTGSWRG